MRLADDIRGWGKPRQIGANPDSDVRAVAAHPRRGPQGKRPQQVARSLLTLLFSNVVYMALLASISSMSACVVPLAPSFQDPPGEPNVAPYIVSSANQDFGTFFQIPPAGLPVAVTVSDQNAGDDLHYRWVIDYPPFSTTNTRPQTDVTIMAPVVIAQPLSFVVSCALNPAPNLAVHQLELIVADRPFDKTNTKVLDAVTEDGLVAHANWTFQISCQ
jgi:hypothetical protein